MKIKVQSIHFDADKNLIRFVEEKVDKLKQFYEHIIDGEVFLRLDKNVTQENKIAEIKISTPGKVLLQVSNVPPLSRQLINRLKH